MLKKLTFAAGFGAGYVLGAKAGRERYAQIEAKFREVAGMPAVQQAAASVKETATDLADTAALRDAVNLAVAVASATCRRPGADPPRRAELDWPPA